MRTRKSSNQYRHHLGDGEMKEERERNQDQRPMESESTLPRVALPASKGSFSTIRANPQLDLERFFYHEWRSVIAF